MSRFNVLVVAAVACLAGLAGCARPSAPPAAAPPVGARPTLDESAVAVRLQATFYELRVPADRIAALDAVQLAKADFAKPLPDLGDARPLYRIDQTARLAGERITVGSSEPMVTNSRLTDRGQRIQSVQYNSLGALVDFKAERTGPRQVRVTATTELAAKTEGTVQVADGVPSAVVRKAVLSLQGPMELGEPSVLISADATSLDKDGKAVVYLARVVVEAVGNVEPKK